ncbi:MAG: adenylate/guanylate cyclase domain-containing protein, partial [Gemmatimonadaceae bacterium]
RVAALAPALATAPADAAPAAAAATAPHAESTIVRQRSMRDAAQLLQAALAVPAEAQGLAGYPAAIVGHHARNERKLALLVEVAKGLARAVELTRLLDNITEYVFQTMDVDRVAIMLSDESEALVPTLARDRTGALDGRIVPQSISRRVVSAQVAILSDNAPEDSRFGGQSILQQRVRSAMCAPLVGSDGRVHGVLYVDNLTETHRFGDEDLDFLIAFSGIVAAAIDNTRLAERVRRESLVRSNFERYFAPNLAARIAGEQGEVRLGGEKRRVVVLFSDIRDFTPLSETMKPDEVARLLSEYFTVMVECVFRHGGTLDKFVGDALMAQWGAPLGAPDDADRAMRAALDMLRELETLNDGWRAAGRPALEVGIGLNVGEVFAGNIGSERRLEFTVIGDAVNTAARLCFAAGGGEILITGELRAALADPPPLTEREPLELKGKVKPVPVFSVTA